MRPKVIGLHGKAGAGKDTVFERLQSHWPVGFRRMSFADPLKDSASALIKVDRERIEHLKRLDFPCVHITLERPTKANPTPARVAMTMREFLQRYGTEAHRDQMGDDFWVRIGMDALADRQRKDSMLRVGPYTYAFTDCRFENEARAILDHGGEVWLVAGPQDVGAAGHVSEEQLPDDMITRVIDNTYRGETWAKPRDGADASAFGEPDFTHLDNQLQSIVNEWSQT